MRSELVNKKNIWQYKQNKPKYIADDFSNYGVSRRLVFKILLARGVFKWLKVRRDLIKLKDVWKGRIKRVHVERIEAKRRGSYFHAAKLKGYQLALEEVRKEIRLLCHSERWQAPDFDKEANKFLNDLDSGVIK
jgi:hypothetical protein